MLLLTLLSLAHFAMITTTSVPLKNDNDSLVIKSAAHSTYIATMLRAAEAFLLYAA